MNQERPAIPDWCARLGLSMDPLAPGSLPEFYFAGAGRRYFLQQAVQQLHFGSGRVAVLGAEGAGKSALLRACVAELAGVADSVALPASALRSVHDLTSATAAVAGLPAACGESEADLLSALQRLIPEDADPQPVVLALDDAHCLDDAVLAAAARLQLQSGGRIRLLLTGEPGLLDALDALAEPPPFERLRLTPLTADEVGDYVLARLRAAGYDGPQPLDDLALEALMAGSGGHIGALHPLLPRVLAMPAPASPVAVARGLPLWHLVAASALLAGVVVALLYLRDAQPVEVREVALFPAEQEAPRESAAADPGPAPRPPPEPPPAARADAAAPAEKSPNDGADAVQDGADRISAAKESPSPSINRGSRGEVAAVEVAPTGQGGSGGAPKQVESVAIPAFSDDEKALLQWPGDAFAVQLFAARELERVRIAAQGVANARVFEGRLQGRPWYVAVSGPYTQRDAAVAAVAGLPSALRQAGPWVRPVADIQAQIRARD